MRLIYRLPIVLLFLVPALSPAQNFPDRLVTYDPLGNRSVDSTAFDWLTAERIHVEFARYTNGSGNSHRWNAKLGGFVELARWDSTWSIALVGTTEIVIDPNNSIGFNPRSIFWEEGLLVSRRLGHNAAIQLGGMQRCKHDIDNLELSYNTGRPEERTLIFSGATLRMLMRPDTFIPDLDFLRGGLALRDDYYFHLLDHRIPSEANNAGGHLDRLINTLTVGGRLELRPAGSRIGGHLGGSIMISLSGGAIHGDDRFSNLSLATSIPFVEAGLDLFNPTGSGLTLFVRGEWQRDAQIVPVPERASLVLIGFRFADVRTVW
jgi:hypothetical protein